ncbi:basic helix-loop-helix transcription factor scleraxis-like [Culicoides brevitarsis]|uniref:basic helix-loop-helix transcription factor scleraxis-like n=1 Tax=Culicoides brevitarsis TaxID=469753 RepID=UPI00307B86B8
MTNTEYFSCASDDSAHFSVTLTDNWLEFDTTNGKLIGKERSHANARERNLPFFSVNSAFTTLRQLIPTEPKNRKLSKIETLRLAKSYIAHLGAILVTDGLVRQPCLQKHRKLSKQVQNGNDQETSERTNICTFCVSYKK